MTTLLADEYDYINRRIAELAAERAGSADPTEAPGTVYALWYADDASGSSTWCLFQGARRPMLNALNDAVVTRFLTTEDAQRAIDESLLPDDVKKKITVVPYTAYEAHP